jgi:hypothetical protein
MRRPASGARTAEVFHIGIATRGPAFDPLASEAADARDESAPRLNGTTSRVIPAEAGIQTWRKTRVAALDSRFRGNDRLGVSIELQIVLDGTTRDVIPAEAGIQTWLKTRVAALASRLRGNDRLGASIELQIALDGTTRDVIPAEAGIQTWLKTRLAALDS